LINTSNHSFLRVFIEKNPLLYRQKPQFRKKPQLGILNRHNPLWRFMAEKAHLETAIFRTETRKLRLRTAIFRKFQKYSENPAYFRTNGGFLRFGGRKIAVFPDFYREKPLFFDIFCGNCSYGCRFWRFLQNLAENGGRLRAVTKFP